MTQEDLDAKMLANFKIGTDRLMALYRTQFRSLNGEDATQVDYVAAQAIGEISFWNWRSSLPVSFETYGSPLESVFHIALHLAGYAICDQPPIYASCRPTWKSAVPLVGSDHCPEQGFDQVAICCQHRLPPYRVDFLVVGAGWKGVCKVVAEVDGHDFHERTKEQARHDKKRDRDLVAAGFKVVRFTGSEIYADPVARAVEVIKLAIQHGIPDAEDSD